MTDRVHASEAREGQYQEIEMRINRLLAEMTLEEKASQMLHESPAIPRLGIPAYNWWNEALHGVGRAGRATVFPQAIGLAATFDPELVHCVAAAISEEARAKHHEAARHGNRSQYRGLTFWTPNVNLFRDPRWGRGQETFGEDPSLIGELASAFVRGLQGDDPFWLKSAACAKHYAVHSGPEKDRHSFDARVSPRHLWDSYLPGFRRVVEVGVEAVMGAYNRTNGEPCCGSPTLLVEVLRELWDFQGHVVSDCWAIRDFHEGHGVTANVRESAAKAVRDGCDLNCGDSYAHLADAVREGLLDEPDVDRAVKRLFRTRARLGILSEEAGGPFVSHTTELIGCESHRALAREAAKRSVVLLKNRDSSLPLGAESRRIFVTGPHGVDQMVLLGNYFGINDRLVSIVEGIAARAGEERTVDYRVGCPTYQDVPEGRNFALTDAEFSDTVVYVGGLSPLLEGEEGEAIAAEAGGDRSRIELPEVQLAYLRLLRKRAKRLIVILTGGSPQALEEVHELADALLFAWYPGQEGGTAIAEILFGEASPEGKLPVSFPKRTEDLPPFEEYSMEGRTYRYRQKDPQYPFGFGLSYTAFRYRALELSTNRLSPGERVTVSFEIENAGLRRGREIAQLYLLFPEPHDEGPSMALKRFRSVELLPETVQRVEFVLHPEDFLQVTAEGNEQRVPGQYTIAVGGCSPGERGAQLGASELLTATVYVV